MNAAVYVGAAIVAIGSIAAFAIRRSRRAEVAERLPDLELAA
jgi:energy-converting hydrogenase Eha subunit E